MEESIEKDITKIVLVTGASRGIGNAIAKKLSKKYIVIANYNKSEEEAKKLQNENHNIDIFKADVSKRADVRNMVDYVIGKYGRIDVLINNAGIDQEKMFQDITDEDWENIMKINLYSVFCTTQEALKYMINKKDGCIINISSMYGIIGGSCAVGYSAAKAGIDGITKSLAKELGPSNIRVNSIAPGFINTEMNSYLTDNEVNDFAQETPLKKIGEGIDIARCVEWLIEDEFTTGQVISIDGGIVI
jgi:3-oxoacyl-[acyl-carrier protein] reductase